MAKAKAAHHRGDFDARSAALRATVTNASRCWRCDRTLPEHEPHHDGAPATWQAGHAIDGNPASPLLLEASTCNGTAGGKLGAARLHQRRSTGYRWP